MPQTFLTIIMYAVPILAGISFELARLSLAKGLNLINFLIRLILTGIITKYYYQ